MQNHAIHVKYVTNIQYIIVCDKNNPPQGLPGGIGHIPVAPPSVNMKVITHMY